MSPKWSFFLEFSWSDFYDVLREFYGHQIWKFMFFWCFEKILNYPKSWQIGQNDLKNNNGTYSLQIFWFYTLELGTKNTQKCYVLLLTVSFYLSQTDAKQSVWDNKLTHLYFSGNLFFNFVYFFTKIEDQNYSWFNHTTKLGLKIEPCISF